MLSAALCKLWSSLKWGKKTPIMKTFYTFPKTHTDTLVQSRLKQEEGL